MLMPCAVKWVDHQHRPPPSATAHRPGGSDKPPAPGAGQDRPDTVPAQPVLNRNHRVNSLFRPTRRTRPRSATRIAWNRAVTRTWLFSAVPEQVHVVGPAPVTRSMAPGRRPGPCRIGSRE
jgi:hypothetical protein